MRCPAKTSHIRQLPRETHYRQACLLPGQPQGLSFPEEHEMGPRGSAPRAKKHSLALLECVFNGRVPDTTSDAYLLFGFAACINTSEKNLLRNLYQAILRDWRHKQGTFRGLSGPSRRLYRPILSLSSLHNMDTSLALRSTTSPMPLHSSDFHRNPVLRFTD